MRFSKAGICLYRQYHRVTMYSLQAWASLLCSEYHSCDQYAKLDKSALKCKETNIDNDRFFNPMWKYCTRPMLIKILCWGWMYDITLLCLIKASVTLHCEVICQSWLQHQFGFKIVIIAHMAAHTIIVLLYLLYSYN